MICLGQYRAAIGYWHIYTSCPPSINSHLSNQLSPIYTYFIFLSLLCCCYGLDVGSHPALYICFLLLVICGDIHPNPGPWPAVSDGINICHLNTRSLLKPGRLDELYTELCCLHNFDIIGISESHLSNDITDDSVHIPHYNSFRRDRNRQGGGVMIYVHDKFLTVRRHDLETQTAELLWIEIKLPTHTLLIGTCYRPPNQSADQTDDFIDSLNSSLSSLSYSQNQSMILLGDFNDRCTAWESDHRDSELGLKLYNLVKSFNLFQLITQPTRNDHLLDLLITDSPGYFMDVDTLPPIDNLDHSIIQGLFKVVHPKPQVVKRKIWQYNLANFDSLNNLLLLHDWDNFFDATDDVNILSHNFTSLLTRFSASCIPVKYVTIRSRDKPGMTSDVRKMFSLAKRYHKRARRTQNPIHIEIFREARREAKACYKRSQTKFYSDISNKLLDSSTCTKSYWRLTKLVYGPKIHKGIPDLTHGNTVVSDTPTKANLLNSYFTEQCKLPPNSDTDIPSDPGQRIESTLADISTTPGEVYNILRRLDVSKASGPDGISNRILKECAQSLCIPLCRLFNLSLLTAQFPSNWKLANVVPIHKKNDRQLVKNYRPVSLLCTISKVLERIVHSRLYEYCIAYNLLTDRNSGFKKGDSTVNQLLTITHKITQALDNKSDVCMVFLDISKAFDKVWHLGLLHKLKFYGLSDNLVHWFESYLSGRQQKVIIDGVSSTPAPVQAGVPQGSILGPLLFLIYINDLVCDLICEPFLYADDTMLIETFNSPLDCLHRINHDLSIIHSWGTRWKVHFNPDKTLYMVVSKKKTPIPFPHPTFNNKPINRTKSHKHLGLHFTDDLTWREHIDNTIVKANRRIHMMNQVRFLLPRCSLISLFKNMVLPIIEYCDIIYDNCSVKSALDLENVQRRASLICTGAYRHTSNDSLLAELGWQPLRIRRQSHKLNMLFKILNFLTPRYLTALIPRSNNIRTGLRSSSSSALPLPFSRLSSTRNAYIHSTVKLWNSLDESLRSSDSFSCFKKGIERHMYKKYNVTYLPYLYRLSPLGRYPVILSRLRMGLSALNSHRFKYNFIGDKSCVKCGNSNETVHHFLFNCPAYAAPRNTLLDSLKEILPPDIINEASTLETVLIFGSAHLDIPTNISVFSTVYNYLESTGRFTK